MASNLLEISGNLSAKREPIQHDGSMLIKGSVENCNLIIARDDIEISGDVINSKVRSVKGSVIVRGSIKGENSFIYSFRPVCQS